MAREARQRMCGARTGPGRATAGIAGTSGPRLVSPAAVATAEMRSGGCSPQPAASRTPAARALVAQLQDGKERLLRDLDAPDLLHPPLAGLLLLQQLALARDVAAVALGDHVLAVGLDRLARDHVGPDGRLDGHVVLLARDALAQLLAQAAPG